MDEQLIANVESRNSAERYGDGVVILLKLLDNVIREPQNGKYRAIRLENKVIKEKLLCLTGIRELLAGIGFEEVCSHKITISGCCYESSEMSFQGDNVGVWTFFFDISFCIIGGCRL